MASDGRKNHDGKVAFITGAGSRIGRATALMFAREGAGVVVADISEQGNRETARMIEELGGQAIAVKCDVSRVEDVRSALDKTIETFGHLDIAFNNAGIEQEMGAAADVAVEEFDRIIATNLRGL
jgi:NAD(P)-dependent dehydrogenase (short-subunit alcohol dehydrogenase family)